MSISECADPKGEGDKDKKKSPYLIGMLHVHKTNIIVFAILSIKQTKANLCSPTIKNVSPFVYAIYSLADQHWPAVE